MFVYSEIDKKKIEEAYIHKDESEKQGIFFCTIEDKVYPSALKKLKDAPVVLYYKGNIEAINQNKNIAVIGSRKVSEKGLKWSFETGKAVADQKLNVVNGLAVGCDTGAIQGALSVGGVCVAILPCGLEQIYPKTNQKLSDKIVSEGGCLLSEYPIGTTLQKHLFVRRDRLQSGISQGVIVVEAEKDSGTMHTVEFAQKQRKRLACYYSSLLKMSSGNKYLEEKGIADVLKHSTDLQFFLQKVSEEKDYKQLTLFDLP